MVISLPQAEKMHFLHSIKINKRDIRQCVAYHFLVGSFSELNIVPFVRGSVLAFREIVVDIYLLIRTLHSSLLRDVLCQSFESFFLGSFVCMSVCRIKFQFSY